jgi:phage shock protein PspC (stress-responsive transcriptional regulator)
MRKTISANIGGTLLHIDEDAYILLDDYLKRIERGYNYSSEGKEIVTDLENRIAELLSDRTNKFSRTVTSEDITWAISIVGRPEDIGSTQYQRHEHNQYNTYSKPARRLYRDADNRVFGGVCSGMAVYFDMDPVLIRIILVVLFFTGFGPLFYIIMWIVIPKARTVTQKLEMRGEAATPENIRKYSL